jgi:hypothetical protein
MDSGAIQAQTYDKLFTNRKSRHDNMRQIIRELHIATSKTRQPIKESLRVFYPGGG